MMLSKKLDVYMNNAGTVIYTLLQNNVVDMPNAGIFSYSITKRDAETNELISQFRHIKSKEAVMLIWADIKAGIQK